MYTFSFGGERLKIMGDLLLVELIWKKAWLSFTDHFLVGLLNKVYS